MTGDITHVTAFEEGSVRGSPLHDTATGATVT